MLDWALNHYVLSFFVFCYNLCFKIYFVWCKCMEYFFRSFTFILCVSLSLKKVSCREHIYGSCFLSSYLPYVYLLGNFVHLFLITDKCILITSLLKVFFTDFGFLLLRFLLFVLSFILHDGFLMLCLDSFLLWFSVFIICFWFPCGSYMAC